MDALRTIRVRLANSARYELRVNCRNTPQIADSVHILGGLTPPYRGVRREDHGPEADIQHHKTSNEQQAALMAWLTRLGNEGFAERDTVILSTRAGAAAAAASLGGDWKHHVQPAPGANAQQFRYCSIHAFKGLEAPAVVVTDIDAVGTEEALALLYVSISRALERLVNLIHDRARQELLKLLMARTAKFGVQND